MRNILSFLLCLMLLVSAEFSVFADEMTEEKLSTLYDYGIFHGDESGNLNMDKHITRAEFCKVIMTSLGYSDEQLSELGETEDFNDVDKSHWAYLYIHNAKKLSLIEGYENEYFFPESTINVVDVERAILSSLGYDIEASGFGGYPNGYVQVAINMGLTRDIDCNPYEAAVRRDVAMMIYKALNIPVMSIIGEGDDREYIAMSGAYGGQRITLKRILDGEVTDFILPQEMPLDYKNDIPSFNGPEYTSRLVIISDLQANSDGYTFTNSQNTDDKSTYVINDETYVYITRTTVGLDEIENGLYALCWYYTDDSDNIELLKIEIMQKPPMMFEQVKVNEG